MIGRYLRQAVWPDALVVDYGVPRPLSLGSVWVSAVLIATLVAASLVALFRWPRVGFLCVVFFILLAPASSVIPITTEVGAERRMYLALAALTILVVTGGAWVIDRVRPRIPRRVGEVLPAVAVAAAFAWVGTLGVLTTHRNGEFATPVTLWRGSVERWPQGRARILYAEALADAGDHHRPSTSCKWRCATSRKRGQRWDASSRRQGGMARRCASCQRSSPPSRVPRIRCLAPHAARQCLRRHTPLRRGHCRVSSARRTVSREPCSARASRWHPARPWGCRGGCRTVP